MKLNQTGHLKKTGQAYTISAMSLDDLPIIHALQEEVYDMVENKSALQMLTDSEFRTILKGDGYMVGTYVADKLIAFRAMLYPSIHDPEHLAADAGLDETAYPETIYSEISIVHPGFRGNALQAIMGELVMEMIDKKRFKYCAATVAPGNIPSMKDKFYLGMYIVQLTEKYDGKERYVFFKKLLETNKFTDEKELIEADDTQRQIQLFNAGYLATELILQNEKFYLNFTKEV